MIPEREQPVDPMPEWLDLKALTGYACVSERFGTGRHIGGLVIF
jgi:hypothetical protein